MPHPPESERDSQARRERRRRTHQRIDSNGDPAPRSRRRDGYEYGSPSNSPTKQKPSRHRDGRSSRPPDSEYSKTASAPGTALSSGQLAQLDKLNRKLGWSEYDGMQQPRINEDEEATRAEYDDDREREREEREKERERRRQERRERRRREREEEQRGHDREGAAAEVYTSADEYTPRRKAGRERERRVVSGQRLERGTQTYYSEKEEYREDVRRRDGGGSSSDDEWVEAERKRKRRRNIIVGVVILLVILAIAIPVAIVVSKKQSTSSNGGAPAPSSSAKPANSNLNGIQQSSIPQAYQGTSFDPFTWYDTNDFNVTFTPQLVGGLPIMGLNDTWDDSKGANNNTIPLNQAWQYGTMPIRGVNLGGWLSIEPFITPSFFSSYTTHDNVVDEYTLTHTLGASKALSTLDQHYSQFVSEQTFADIQAAGFDHVRIPFSYWAVITYDGDPYVANVSWRYLLRGIEWARKYGLRINLDLHGAPGSQNGWNHSGRQGTIGWLNGTDGTLNGQRTLDIHKQLSTFFTQPRYKNIITMYGLVNEPRMVVLDTDAVLTWTQNAITEIRGNNFTGIIVFGDGFMGLQKWQGKLQNDNNLLLDVHQYVIFNVDQVVLDHTDKIHFACGGWTQQALQSENKATGFGPTLCGEWSQADTDCAQYLNNVGVGSRWEGTLNMAGTPGGSTNGSVLSPTCPTNNSPQCSCDGANADPVTYSAPYKQWLLMFAEAQMDSFEQGWGWFYWTWQTEKATQWSYKAGLAAGIMPKLAFERGWNCNMTIPDYAGAGLAENY